MKVQKSFLLLFALLTLPLLSIYSQKMSTLIVNTKFTNIEKGYDHLTKTVVFVDDELVASTSEKLQSIPNSVKVKIPKGEHKVRVINYAFYEGNWEEHTIENNYSVDCLYELNMNFKKSKYKLDLVFDIDSETKAKLK